MIVAVPEQRTEQRHPMGGPPGMDRTPYLATTTWFTWYCTTCRLATKGGILFSHASCAIEMGEDHEARAECQVLGQLSLFALAGGAR